MLYDFCPNHSNLIYHPNNKINNHINYENDKHNKLLASLVETNANAIAIKSDLANRSRSECTCCAVANDRAPKQPRRQQQRLRRRQVGRCPTKGIQSHINTSYLSSNQRSPMHYDGRNNNHKLASVLELAPLVRRNRR